MVFRFHICEFAYSLNLFVTPKHQLSALSWLFTDMHRMVKKVSRQTHTFPSEIKEGNAPFLSEKASSLQSIQYQFPPYLCIFGDADV